MRCSLVASPLAWSVVAFVASGSPRVSVAGEPTPADLFGLDLGTPWPVLESATKSSLACREFGTPPNALSCKGALVKWGRLEPGSTTFWIASGRVSKIFAVSRLLGYDFPQSEAAFRERYSQMVSILGRPATIPAVEPAREIDDEQKLVLLGQGRLGLKAIWRFPRRDLSLSLHGDQGTPVLVVGLEPAAPPSCEAHSVAAMLANLFPPASPLARVLAAQDLAACQVAGAAGALAAAAEASSDSEVQVEAVRALGALGPAGLPLLERIADTRGRAAEEARIALAQTGTRYSVAPNATPERSAGPGHAPAAQLPMASSPPVARPALIGQPSPTREAGPEAWTSQPALGRGAAARPIAQAGLAPRTPEAKPADSEKPATPTPPRDGTFLTLATSLVAGGVWGGGLSLLAQQSSPGVVLLVGSAGAVIGGGTAWGITHFGLRPSPTQALWFANSTAWGTLAGLAAWAGSGSDNLKLKWGLLVGGESIGMGMGVLGARKWDWTGSQVLLANTLVFGAGLVGAGGRMLAQPSEPLRVSPLVGYGAAPAMIGAAILSRYIQLSKDDVNMATAASAAGAWSAGLLAYGLDGGSTTRDYRLLGGALAGMGGGYLGMAVLSPFVDVAPSRTWSAMAGLLAGNLLGLGSYMIAEPDETLRRPLAASLGGLGLGLGTFVAYPYLRLGPQAPILGSMGAAWGAGTWGLAMAASNDHSTGRLQGGVLALGTGASIAGLLASGSVAPGAADYAVTVTSAALGASAGIGVAKLATDATGAGELAGTLAGSTLGLVAGSTFSHYAGLRAPDLGAAALGAGSGGLIGALAPTLAQSDWGGWSRNNQGGLLLGIPAGAFAAAGLSRWRLARGEDIGVATAGSALGLGIGTGIGLLWPDSYSQPTRIGALAGTTAGMAGALVLARGMDGGAGLGESAPLLGVTGAALGAVQGALLAGIVDPSGMVSQTSPHAIAGGLVLGSSAGLASGLLLSRYYAPNASSLGTVALADGIGAMFGRGLAMTIFDTGGRRDTSATLAGSLVGLGAAALVEHASPFSSTDLWAGAEGMSYGAIVGALAPTLADPTWGTWQRTTEGGLLLGLGGGAFAGATLGHLAGASPGAVAISSAGALLGLGVGAGTGLIWPTDYSRPARIGAVAGVSGGLAASLLLAKPLRLRDGLGESAVGLGAIGAGIGAAEGVLLAALVDPSGEISKLTGRQVGGGALLGGSAGLASGLLLSRYYTPGASELGVTVGGTVLGGLLGRGLVMSASPSGGQRDSAGTLAGALAGTAAGAITEHLSPLDGVDLIAGAEGAAIGGVVGALAPSLADKQWGGWQRNGQGGLLLGLSGGAVAATGLAHATGVSGRTLGLGMAGAFDGALTGAGIGLLADPDPASTQGARTGVVAGAASGLAIGLGLWPRLDFDADDLLVLASATAVGGWTGGWAPVLGNGAWADVDGTKIRGGLLAGAGGASILATALLPSLHVDRDVLGKALLLHALFSGAGAGAGALASRRADAPVWGMLGAGTAGLLLGGGLHGAIDLGASRGLLAFAGVEGLWAGAWLPYLLRPASEVRSTDVVAGLAVGGLGGAGLSLLAGTIGTPSSQRLAMAGIGSAVGASLAGGSVLLADELHDQRGVGIMLGGTAAGLGLGALVSPLAPLDSSRGLHMFGGAGLGAAEGLAFAWAGRGTTQSQFAGSALIGAGVGATLGLAASTDAEGLSMQQALVASGFSAWGGWIGSFSGAFANRDPHEVVLGGLAAANVGFLAGYGALRYDLVEPRDFAWLSLAGALGTAVGGGLGAALSSQSDPRPVLAGLAAGPLVGLGAGAFIVPWLRHKTSAASLRTSRVAGVRFDLTARHPSTQRNSTDVLADAKPSKIVAGLKLAQRHFFDVSNWTPVFGALPPLPGDPNPAPFFMGISGGLR
jgi:hypothetical protein